MWIEIIILLVPLIVGGIQAYKKYDAVDDFTENYNDWITEKSRNTGRGNTLPAKIARFTLVPFYSLFTTIHDLTENIRDFGLRSGIRIAAYLYLVAFLFVIFITIGYKVLILAVLAFVLLIAFVLIRNSLPGRRSTAFGDSSEGFVEKIWPFFRSDSTRERVAGLFDVAQIDVDYTGNILTYEKGAAPGKKKIGRVDKHGHIYDTRRAAAVKIGWIDDQGRVIGDRIINRD